MKLTEAGAPNEIIVVDDETVVCDLLRRGLNEDNFRVTAYTHPGEVAVAVEARKPCLVILDIHLPGMNGLEVLKRIKETSPEVPVLLISGSPEAPTRDEARRLGACDFLQKPLNWGYLRNIAYLSSFLKESQK